MLLRSVPKLAIPSELSNADSEIIIRILPQPFLDLLPIIYYPPGLPPLQPRTQGRSSPSTVYFSTPFLAPRNCERSYGVEEPGYRKFPLLIAYVPPILPGATIVRATDELLVANMLILIGLGVSAPAWFFILALYIYTSGVGL